MKRIAALALLVISSFLPCTAQQQEKRRPGIFDFRGPVRSISEERVTVTEVNGEAVEGARIPVQTINYNEDGTKQELIIYQPDGTIRAKRTFLYDQDGRLLEVTEFTGINHDLPIRTVYQFDREKNVTEMTVYKPDGSVLNRRTIVRQQNPQATESTVYDENGTVVSRGTMSNSPQGRRFETNSYGANGGVQSKTETISTTNGTRTYERRVSGNPLYREEVIPGEKGSGMRIVYNEDGSVQRRERYTTEFDSHGNSIKATRSVAEGDSKDFKLVEVTYRTIEYYQ